ELEKLREVFIAMDADSDGCISEGDLSHILASFKYKPRRGEVADMIWEVDEDCDGQVSWAEFELMFTRCRSDTAFLEPRKLFNVVDFMMHDKDRSGKISFDEVMEIFFRRYGKSALEQRTNEFLANDVDHDNEISFTEFHATLNSQEHASKKPSKNSRAGSGRGAKRA
ncbi:hypothetical protein T492DRAFT_554792, partial [Pavlovales sp. CCMP2436]